jgi:hypothetical protein
MTTRPQPPHKIPVPAVWVLLALSLARDTPAQTLMFDFAGQITQKRAQNSAFSNSVGGQFSGSFSYDAAAVNLEPPGDPLGYYPLISFTLDGKSINVSNGAAIPFIPGLIVNPLPFGMSIEIRGFDLPAAAGDPNDNGSTSVLFRGFTGFVLPSNAPPTAIDPGSFTNAEIIGPIFVGPFQAPTSSDLGIVTQIVEVPEPTSASLCASALTCALFMRLGPKRLRRNLSHNDLR